MPIHSLLNLLKKAELYLLDLIFGKLKPEHFLLHLSKEAELYLLDLFKNDSDKDMALQIDINNPNTEAAEVIFGIYSKDAIPDHYQELQDLGCSIFIDEVNKSYLQDACIDLKIDGDTKNIIISTPYAKKSYTSASSEYNLTEEEERRLKLRYILIGCSWVFVVICSILHVVCEIERDQKIADFIFYIGCIFSPPVLLIGFSLENIRVLYTWESPRHFVLVFMGLTYVLASLISIFIFNESHFLAQGPGEETTYTHPFFVPSITFIVLLGFPMWMVVPLSWRYFTPPIAKNKLFVFGVIFLGVLLWLSGGIYFHFFVPPENY